jgi:hypothetical protein
MFAVQGLQNSLVAATTGQPRARAGEGLDDENGRRRKRGN